MNQLQNKNDVSQENPPHNGAEHNGNGDPNIAQVRQLIFGQQMTDYEERFSTLEQKLTDEMNTMKASVEQGLAELREFIRSRSEEVESASVPRSQIAESLEKLAKTLRS